MRSKSVRRSSGDRISALSEAKESELGRLRNQVHTLQAAIPPPQPKKVIGRRHRTCQEAGAQENPPFPSLPAPSTQPAATPLTASDLASGYSRYRLETQASFLWNLLADLGVYVTQKGIPNGFRALDVGCVLWARQKPQKTL